MFKNKDNLLNFMGKDISLGDIIRQILINDRVIVSLCGSSAIGDSNYESNTLLRHEKEQEQENLYAMLDEKERLYSKNESS